MGKELRYAGLLPHLCRSCPGLAHVQDGPPGVSWAAFWDGVCDEFQGNVARVGKELRCGDMQPPLARVQLLLVMDDVEVLTGVGWGVVAMWPRVGEVRTWSVPTSSLRWPGLSFCQMWMTLRVNER